MNRQLLVLILLVLSGSLVACGANPDDSAESVVVVATDSPPDLGFTTYEHESGVFSIRVPPAWVVDDLPDPNGVRVQFTVLEDTESVVRLSIYIVNTGDAMTREGFLNASNAYQPPEDVASYEWQQVGIPIDQADGSRRLAGVRYYPVTGQRTLNIFMQGNGTYFSALEVDVTDADEATLRTLNAVVNTFRVNTDAVVDVGEVVVATTFTGDVGFEGYTAWADDDGGFNITGRVINLTTRSLEAIRITGYLFDARGNQLSEKSLILTTDILESGGSAPFRIRFDGGRPSTAVRYELHAAARSADLAASDFYGSNNFEVQQNPAYYSESGNLVLSGRVINTGTQLATEVKVVVAVLDEQGTVVSAETAFIDRDQLLPGEVGNYQVVIYDVGGAAVRYELTVMGLAE